MTRVTIATYADLVRYRYTMTGWCPTCVRGAPVDLAAMVAAGRGDERYVGRRIRCSICGHVAWPIIRPPESSGAIAAYPGVPGAR